MATTRTSAAPDASVVISTFERPEMLTELLDSLAAQDTGGATFEVIVVDDCSSDSTPAMLAAEQERGRLDLRTIRHERNLGQGAGRNTGWRAARAPLVAFTDDDCVVDPGWLRALLDHAAESPGALICGRTDARPDQEALLGPFSRTQVIHRAGPDFQTCNILYARSLLARLDGFDAEAFPSFGGEDTDLAWRAIEAGADVVYADSARVYHAVRYIGPIGRLRLAASWHQGVNALARHPGLRRALLKRRIFWKENHFLLARALVGLALPARVGPIPLRAWLAAPYVKNLLMRGSIERSGPATSILLAPYFLVLDLTEVAAMIRGSARYRTLVL
jgi:glycosyltransferase involved in cell wall biosynthesis